MKEEIENALEDLESFVEYARVNYTMVGFLGVVHSANTIKDSLEKQIAILPNYEGPTSEAKDDVEMYCPECDYYFEDELSYCPNCGQKIWWP